MKRWGWWWDSKVSVVSSSVIRSTLFLHLKIPDIRYTREEREKEREMKLCLCLLVLFCFSGTDATFIIYY